MKKTSFFMTAVAATGILCVSLSLINAKQTYFPLHDVKGNSEALRGVSFSGTVNLNTASVVVSYDNQMRQHHEIKEPQSYYSVSYSNFNYVREGDSKAISDWKKAEEQTDTASALYERKLDKADLYLSVMYTNENNDTKDLGFIKTDLSYVADEDHILKEQGFYEDEIKSIQSTWIAPETIQSSEEWSQPVYTNGYYYILPPSTIDMSGQNYIYRAKERNYAIQYDVSSVEPNNYYLQNKLDLEKLTKVDMDRNYLALRISSNHLIVFSEMNHKLYITKYDMNGKQIDEISVDNYSYLGGIYQNDAYICFIHDKSIQILNTNNMKLESTENTDTHAKDSDMYPINDVLYKNGRIYVSLNDGKLNETVNKILVIEQGETIYAGTLDLIKTRSSLYDETMPCNTFPITFRR